MVLEMAGETWRRRGPLPASAPSSGYNNLPSVTAPVSATAALIHNSPCAVSYVVLPRMFGEDEPAGRAPNPRSARRPDEVLSKWERGPATGRPAAWLRGTTASARPE